MKTLLKGETSIVSTRLPTSLSSIPTWSVLDDEDDIVSTGAATKNASGLWEASFTVPKTAQIPDGEAEWSIVFEGTTGAGRDVSKIVSFTVLDTYEDWQSFGLLYLNSQPEIIDVALFDKEPSAITLLLRDGYDTGNMSIVQTTISDPVADSLTTRGYGYTLRLPIEPGLLTDQSAGIYPYQFMVTATIPGAIKPDIIVKPLYIVTPTFLTRINGVKRYLDKARMDDIDPNLSWTDEEIMHFLLEGASYINGVAEGTYYSVLNMPPPLLSYLQMAAAWQALNARYLAETMNQFEFQGTNTSLNFDRRDGISAKMSELLQVLDQQLPSIKKSVIRMYGSGTPPPIPGATAKKSIATIGIAYSPVTNRTAYPFLRRTPYGAYRW